VTTQIAPPAPVPTAVLNEQQLGLIIQYTVEAYKTFEKLAENLPNPMAATTFKQFAVDERENRDLIELKIAAIGGSRVRVTLGGDLQFQDVLEGDLSYRELTEFLIARERTMERRLADLARNAPTTDRNLLVYLISTKRAHVVELERELEMIKTDPDWFKREDAEWRIVHGTGA
jgi:rubrerythrin